MNTAQKIELRKAEAKFTRAKKVEADKPKAYRKAKQELSDLRKSLRNTHPVHSPNGDATAQLTTLNLKSKQTGA